MTTFDIILLALAVGVLIYQVNLLLRAKREILIPGTPPNRGAILVVLGLVLVLAVVRTPNLGRTWPVFVIIGLACLAIFAGGCGLSSRGMFGNGRFIPFTQAAYYEVNDRNGQKLFRLSRVTRETQMLIPEDKLPAVLEMMEQNGVPHYEAYTKKMAKRAGERVAASQKKKKKK